MYRQVPQSSVTPPFYTYDHNSGSAVIGGPFYTGSLYPEAYHGNFFFGDYSGNFIKRVVLDEDVPDDGAAQRYRKRQDRSGGESGRLSGRECERRRTTLVVDMHCFE